VVGVHNLRTAALALAVGRAFGLPGAVVMEGLAAMEVPAMRSTLVALGTLLVLSDAYNANPASMREALATLDAIDTGRQRVAILGSMLELGPQGPSLHDELARRALASRADVIAGVGAFAEAFARVAPGEGRVVTAPDPATVWPQLAPRLAPDALVLLKGSRGVRLEQLLARLAEHAGAAAPSSHH
jgi:UDP-N-acetylmuramoyl-tripeptide--D-alanyl-D-alanine ligase